MEYTFKDYYQNEVKLSFKDQPFSKEPKHVWVICKYDDQWLLTKHRGRGMEFPGGKVEAGETAEVAAVREVMEETGGIVQDLQYIAQYFVSGKSGTIIKNVYFATIKALEKQTTYFETLGPVLLDEIPENIKEQKQYSFMMKDGVLCHCLPYIRRKFCS